MIIGMIIIIIMKIIYIAPNPLKGSRRLSTYQDQVRKRINLTHPYAVVILPFSLLP